MAVTRSNDVVVDERPGEDAPTRTRAAAMPPDERRAAIIEATIPLLLEHGSSVTTRQIAEAAGIAEGTIFRVFPDKESLLSAAVEKALDAAPLDAALLAIDRDLPLEERLVTAVDVIKERVNRVWLLMTAVGMTKPPQRAERSRGTPDVATLALLFEPDQDSLRRDPTVSAQLLRGLTFAGSHPALIVGEPMASTEIVSLVLDGVRRHADDERAP
jgi:AcrR family transcriptional regulator